MSCLAPSVHFGSNLNVDPIDWERLVALAAADPAANFLNRDLLISDAMAIPERFGINLGPLQNTIDEIRLMSGTPTAALNRLMGLLHEQNLSFR
jgi:hypothetical protein